MKTKFFVTVAAGVLALTSFAATAADQLRVGTHPTFAPFEFMDSGSGEYVGFDIDLIREVGKRLGKEVEIVNMGFDALIPAVLTNQLDVAASGITITEERKKRVSFSDPYYEAGLGMLVREESSKELTNMASLKNRTVCVQIGTTGAEAAKKIEGATIKAFNTSADAFMELRNKGCEAVVTDRPVIGYFMVKNKRAAKGLVMFNYDSNVELLGLAMNKNNADLVAQVNKALSDMKADGTYQKIYSKWFGQ